MHARMASKNTIAASAQLQQYRNDIDGIDEQLASLLIRRSNIVKNVKSLKDTHWPNACHIRPGREAKMHATMFSRFAGSPLGAQAGAEFWRLIISASTMIESPLHVITLRETTTLAQNYFSNLAHYTPASSLYHASELLTQQAGSIVCLQNNFNESTAAFFMRNPALRIFAYAPLVLKNTHYPQAVFIADIACEPSDSDISYFVEHNRIIMLEGYHETHPTSATARFIGAHATPLIRE